MSYVNTTGYCSTTHIIAEDSAWGKFLPVVVLSRNENQRIFRFRVNLLNSYVIENKWPLHVNALIRYVITHNPDVHTGEEGLTTPALPFFTNF